MLYLIDTHCHLYADSFAADIDAVVARAREAGVQHFFLPSIDSTTMQAMFELEERFPYSCHAMMGLHPCSVKENYKEELKLAEEWLGKRKFAAIGETGLDFYWDLSFTQQQYEAFRTQIQWALDYDIPLVIHSRNANKECIDTVREMQHGKLRGIFHCFSGTREEALQVLDLGFHIGIGGVLTFKNSGLKEILKDIPMENIVLETDAPYLAPVPFRGKRNESSYLTYIINCLAEVKGLEVEEAARVTSANAASLFRSTI